MKTSTRATPGAATPHPPAALPLSVRTRLGREVQADLEGAYTAFLARGLTPARAMERARALVIPGPEATERLALLHRPLYAALIRRFPLAVTRRGERLAFVLVSTSTLVVLASVMLGLDLSPASVPFLTPILGVGALVAASLATKAFQLFVKGATPEQARRGLGWPLALSLLLVLVAGGVGLSEVYRFASMAAAAPPEDLAPLVAFVGATATALAVALGLALSGALGWFLLVRAVVSAEEAEPRLHTTPMRGG